jgi:hypothetical protein
MLEFRDFRKSSEISDYTPACRQAGIMDDYTDWEYIED